MGKRGREWRQDTPNEQMIVLLSVLEGHIHNAKHGIIDTKELSERVAPLFYQISELSIRYLKELW